MLKNEKINNSEYYNSRDIIGNYLSRTRNQIVLKYIKGKLMDLGCGDGQLIQSYDGQAIGVDIKNYGAADIVVDNFNSIPQDDQSLDTITIVASLNYFETPKEVLAECYRILDKDGLLILTMPNAHVMKIWHAFREKWAHRSGYSFKQLDDLLTSSNFRLDKKKSFLFGLNHLYIYKKK